MTKVTFADWRDLYVGLRDELAATKQALHEFRRFILTMVFTVAACCASAGVALSAGPWAVGWSLSLFAATLGLLRQIGLAATVGLRMTLLSVSALASGHALGYTDTAIMVVTVVAGWAGLGLVDRRRSPCSSP